MKLISINQYGILFGIILFVTVFICSCSFFSEGKYAADLDAQMKVTVEYQKNDSIPEFRQIISLSKDNYSTTLDANTRVRPFSIYKDSLPIKGKEIAMIFIYDLYLGWVILDYETLDIYKDFSEMPKEQALLTKLRMMENPVLEFDGDGFEE
ncbi:MAG: hypothetical protein ACI94Y_003402 [Maribacter sp.]|jgi:hypothetical protein